MVQTLARPHSIAANTIIAAAGRIVNAAAGLVALSLLARLLGEAPLGTYLLVISYVALVQLAADAGLYLTFTKEIARLPREAPSKVGAPAAAHLLSQVAILRLGLLVVVTAAGLAIATLIPSLRDYPGIYLIIAVGGIAQSLSQLLMGVFQQAQTMWRAVVGDLAARALHLLLIGGLASAGALTLPAAAVSLSASLIAAFIVHQALSPHRIRAVRYDRARGSTLLRDSWPLGLLLLLGALYFKTDVVLISLFRPPSDVGHYGVAFRLIESLLFFPAMLGGLLLPRITASLSQPGGTPAAARYVSEGIAAALLLGAPVVTLLIRESEGIIQAIAGPEFFPAAHLLQIISLALGAMMVGNIFGFALVALEQQRSLLKLYSFLVVGNAAVNCITIPRFGPAGAAWTTVGVECIATLVAGYLVSKRLPLSLPPRLLPSVLLILLAMLVVLAALPTGAPIYVRLPAAAAASLVVAWSMRLRAMFPHLTAAGRL